MRKGVAHGEAKEWYADGTEKSATLYRHGLREGPSSEWVPQRTTKTRSLLSKRSATRS